VHLETNVPISLSWKCDVANTTIQKFGVVKICKCSFERSLFCFPRLHLCDSNTLKTVILNNNCFLCMWIYDQNCIFSIITPVLSVKLSFRNHSNMMICCSRWTKYFVSLCHNLMDPCRIKVFISFWKKSYWPPNFKTLAYTTHTHVLTVQNVILSRGYQGCSFSQRERLTKQSCDLRLFLFPESW